MKERLQGELRGTILSREWSQGSRRRSRLSKHLRVRKSVKLLTVGRKMRHKGPVAG